MSEQMRAFALFVLGAVLFVVALEGDWFARQSGANRPDDALQRLLRPALSALGVHPEDQLVGGALPRACWCRSISTSPIWRATAVGAQMNESNDAMPAGVAGGLVGGALSLFTLKLRGLAGAGATTRNALIGTAVLTVIGGARRLTWSRRGVGGELSAALCLFLPWQIALGWFISRMMRISPPRGEAGRLTALAGRGRCRHRGGHEGPCPCHAEERRPRPAGQGDPPRARRAGLRRRQRRARRQADRARRRRRHRATPTLDEMCRKLLANTVIENYRIEERSGGVKSAVIVFPGSNCDRDLAEALAAGHGPRAGDGLAPRERAARRPRPGRRARAASPMAIICARARWPRNRR